MDIAVQLYAAWFVLVPGLGVLRYVRRIGGVMQALFMLNIAISGNLSFLNHLTIIPNLACLDDSVWDSLCHPLARPWRGKTKLRTTPAPALRRQTTWGARTFIDGILVLTIAYLSVPVVSNLLQLNGSRQVMNASFGAFRLVNTYGAFGNVGQARYEPIVSVSHDGEMWHELELPCKPGRVDRPPCMCAPYHYRLDWNIWFLGFKPHQRYLERRETWMWSFLAKVLDGDEVALSLLAPESASGAAYYPEGLQAARRAPKFVKVDMWRYKMRGPLWKILSEYAANGAAVWWTRTYEEPLIKPLMRDSPLLTNMVQRYSR